MSFKNLEQRFNENVNTLYAGATTKYAGGKASANRTDAPLIVREPGKGYWGAMESRGTPVRSAAQDVKRLTLFQLSPDGIRFLAKQQLLQTGNTFKFTRIINPSFVVANAVPFLHVKRNLRPLSELKKKTDTSDQNVRKMGTMQEDSYKRLAKYKTPIFIDRHLQTYKIGLTKKDQQQINTLLKFIKNPFKTVAQIAGKAVFNKVKNTVGNKLSQAFSPITRTISALDPTLKRNVGEDSKYGWNKGRPELAEGSITSLVEEANINYQSNVDNFFKTELKESTGTKFIKYFDRGDSIGTANKIEGTELKVARGDQATIVNSVIGGLGGRRKTKISYIKDPSNFTKKYAGPFDVLEGLTIPPAYRPINTNFDDPVTVSFAMGKEVPVKFRAFIKDLTESSNPQYQSLQYIGRTEKFVNYTGVQREISFKLAVIAFGPDELDMVWRRINYLTGLTFPYGFTRGIMQPNIVRLTVGGVYTNQPGYISALSTNFNEPASSWDIDKDVPIGATVDIRFTLIEKATRTAQSPFYGITDGSGRSDGKPMTGFTATIPVPQPRSTQDPKKDAPAKQTDDGGEELNVRSARSRRNKFPFSVGDPFAVDINLNLPTVPIGSTDQPPIPFRNNLLPGG